MLRRTYTLNRIRLLEFWIAPILIIAFFVFLVYADYEKNSQVHLGKLIGYILTSLLFIGSFIWLFFNHLKNLQVTMLEFTESNIIFYQGKITNRIAYDEIIGVIEYSNNRHGYGRLPWSDIVKWHIRTENQEMVISSLVISKTNLKKFIKRDWLYESTYFPTL